MAGYEELDTEERERARTAMDETLKTSCGSCDILISWEFEILAIDLHIHYPLLRIADLLFTQTTASPYTASSTHPR